MSISKNKQVNLLLAGSYFQEKLISKYYTCIKYDEEKTVLELHEEILKELELEKNSNYPQLLISMIIQTIFTNFTICYEAYREKNFNVLGTNTLSDLDITVSKMIKIKYKDKPLEPQNIQDCRLLDFMKHMRNSISHCSFEFDGTSIKFKDIDAFAANDITFFAEFTIEEIIDIYRKWQLFFIKNPL